MELNEIKKELYTKKPSAFFVSVKKGHLNYVANVNEGSVHFRIPFEEVGDAVFGISMPARLLIRYIVPASESHVEVIDGTAR